MVCFLAERRTAGLAVLLRAVTGFLAGRGVEALAGFADSDFIFASGVVSPSG